MSIKNWAIARGWKCPLHTDCNLCEPPLGWVLRKAKQEEASYWFPLHKTVCHVGISDCTVCWHYASLADVPVAADSGPQETTK